MFNDEITQKRTLIIEHYGNRYKDVHAQIINHCNFDFFHK